MRPGADHIGDVRAHGEADLAAQALRPHRRGAAAQEPQSLAVAHQQQVGHLPSVARIGVAALGAHPPNTLGQDLQFRQAVAFVVYRFGTACQHATRDERQTQHEQPRQQGSTQVQSIEKNEQHVGGRRHGFSVVDE
jgi:hypothetical protein